MALRRTLSIDLRAERPEVRRHAALLLGTGRSHDLFKATPKPIALFLGMDADTSSIDRHVHRRGLVPTRDVAIITCKIELWFLTGLKPAPAVIDIHARPIGRRAVEGLRWRIAHHDVPVQEMLIAPSLIIG